MSFTDDHSKPFRVRYAGTRESDPLTNTQNRYGSFVRSKSSAFVFGRTVGMGYGSTSVRPGAVTSNHVFSDVVVQYKVVLRCGFRFLTQGG